MSCGPGMDAVVRARAMEVGTAALCALAIAACGGSKADTVSPPPGSAGASGAALGAAAKVAGADWQRFNFDAQRSGVGPSDTGITAGNVGTLGRRRVHLDGTVDSSPIELHGGPGPRPRAGCRVRDDHLRPDDRDRSRAPAPSSGSSCRRTSATTRAAPRSRPRRRSPIPTAGSSTRAIPAVRSTSSRSPPVVRCAPVTGRFG